MMDVQRAGMDYSDSTRRSRSRIDGDAMLNWRGGRRSGAFLHNHRQPSQWDSIHRRILRTSNIGPATSVSSISIIIQLDLHHHEDDSDVHDEAMIKQMRGVQNAEAILIITLP